MTTQIPAYIGLAMPDGKKKKKKGLAMPRHIPFDTSAINGPRSLP